MSTLLASVKDRLKDTKFSAFFSFSPLVGPPKDSVDPKTQRTVSRWEVRLPYPYSYLAFLRI